MKNNICIDLTLSLVVQAHFFFSLEPFHFYFISFTVFFFVCLLSHDTNSFCLHSPLYTYTKTGLIVGVGASMVRDSASVMLGHYFKRRRQFVEMITMSGEGVGVALFSVILKEGVG